MTDTEAADQRCKELLVLNASESQHQGYRSSMELMSDHAKKFETISPMIGVQRKKDVKMSKMLSWLSEHDAFNE